MAICYRCQEPTFLKEHHEAIDGEDRIVCGKCRNVICFFCGKTKREDGINRWTHLRDPETNELFTDPKTDDLVQVGSCCAYVEGLVDRFKLYSEKYRNLQKNRPDIIAKMDEDMENRHRKTKSMIGNKDFADSMIDKYAARKKVSKLKK